MSKLKGAIALFAAAAFTSTVALAEEAASTTAENTVSATTKEEVKTENSAQ
jgi:hypothetical protein